VLASESYESGVSKVDTVETLSAQLAFSSAFEIRAAGGLVTVTLWGQL